jgi:hypothetical protein
VGKPEGKRPLKIPRRRWVDNIKMDLRYNGVVSTGLFWLEIGNSGGSQEQGNAPLGFVKCWEVLE